MDLYTELMEKTSELDIAIKEFRVSGRKYSECERAYRVAKAKASLTLKTQGYAVSLIGDIVYNNEEVANALFERDLSEVIYKSHQEEINSLKLQIRIIEGQLQREYGR